MQGEIERSVELYRSGRINRRDLLKSVIAVTGGYAAAHLFLESSGLSATVISSQEAQAADVDAQSVAYPSGSVTIQAYLAKPKGEGKHPGIVVIHENRGLNEHIRDLARRFAAEGYVALAPDILSRAGGTASMKSPDAATAAINQIPPETSVSDLAAGYDFLQKNDSAQSDRISSVGFCWGGWRSFMLATRVPALYRTIVFYGSTPDSGLQNIHAPVLAHYAQFDFRITGNAIATEDKMKALGKQFTYYIYPGASHAFFNDTGPRYDAAAAKLAWSRSLEFLRS